MVGTRYILFAEGHGLWGAQSCGDMRTGIWGANFAACSPHGKLVL
jgi:hypothetical protein